MRLRKVALIAVLCARAPALAQADSSATPPWTGSAETELQFFSWGEAYAPVGAKTPAHGSQIYMPFSAQAEGALGPSWFLDLAAGGGWVSSRQSGPGAAGSVTTALDSSLSATFAYRGASVVQPFIGLNLNLPTGDADLVGAQAFARADPDLAGVGTFGQGFNVGPTIGANFVLAPDFLFGAALSYAHRGPYQSAGAGFEPIFVTSTVDPGDQIAPTVSLGYKAGRLDLEAAATLRFETDSRLNAANAWRFGPVSILSGSAKYQFTDLWSAMLSASWTHAQPTLVLAGAPPTLLKGSGASDDVLQAEIDPRYRRGPWSIGPTASVLWRRADSFDPATGSIIPAKALARFGGAAETELAPNLTVGARVEAVWLRETPEAALAEPAVSGWGWDARLTSAIRF